MLVSNIFFFFQTIFYLFTKITCKLTVSRIVLGYHTPRWGAYRKHCRKRRKCWELAFSSFPAMFSTLLVSTLKFCYLTHSLLCHFETVPNSKKLQTRTELWLLTLSQTSPGFYVCALEVFL